LKTRIVYIAIAIATVLAGLAITTYYFNLKGLETPISSPAPTYTPAAKATTIGPLRIDVLSIAESAYINGYSRSSPSGVCAKTTSGMKFVVIAIRVKNTGLENNSGGGYFDDLALLTNAGRDYRMFFGSPFAVPAPQDECIKNNAITFLFEPSCRSILEPGKYCEFPLIFIIPQDEIPSELQFVKDGWTVATVSLR
jgi:hypothetical protein